ncbi:MAG: ATP-dependent Clp protease adapter ClpS [Thiotrichales bacterium]|nr:ATP-dependent Clp protease adapter ClpS [Thiotrichales bacterium]
MSEAHDDGNLLLEAAKPKLKPPRRYQVVLLNDDFTTMEFVIEVLQRFFAMSELQAQAVMLKVHHEGKGVCGVYSREVAEMKVRQVNGYAREHKHPLRCQMEVV